MNKKEGGVSSSSDPAVLPLGEKRLEGHKPIKPSLDRNGCLHHVWPSFLPRVPVAKLGRSCEPADSRAAYSPCTLIRVFDKLWKQD